MRPSNSFLAEFAKAPDLLTYEGPYQSRFRVLMRLPHIIHVQKTQVNSDVFHKKDRTEEHEQEHEF